jgi:hypothetical protein
MEDQIIENATDIVENIQVTDAVEAATECVKQNPSTGAIVLGVIAGAAVIGGAAFAVKKFGKNVKKAVKAKREAKSIRIEGSEDQTSDDPCCEYDQEKDE